MNTTVSARSAVSWRAPSGELVVGLTVRLSWPLAFWRIWQVWQVSLTVGLPRTIVMLGTSPQLVVWHRRQIGEQFALVLNWHRRYRYRA